MLPFRIALAALAAVFVIATVLPLWRSPEWWVRMFDFPRVQVTVGALLVLDGVRSELISGEAEGEAQGEGGKSAFSCDHGRGRSQEGALRFASNNKESSS